MLLSFEDFVELVYVRLSSLVHIKKLVILYRSVLLHVQNHCYVTFHCKSFFTYFIHTGFLNLTNFKVYDIRKIF